MLRDRVDLLAGEFGNVLLGGYPGTHPIGAIFPIVKWTSHAIADDVPRTQVGAEMRALGAWPLTSRPAPGRRQFVAPGTSWKKGDE